MPGGPPASAWHRPASDEAEEPFRGAGALFTPSSVAIVGDSPKPSRGGSAHEQLRARGFLGAVYPVNPRYEEVRGEPCSPDLASLAVVPDLVLVATPSETAVEVVQQCAALGVRAVTVFGSGFADAGEAGAALQARLRAAALGGGIALCGPNCYGVANLLDGVAATSVPLSPELEPGGLALVLQSGALSHGVIDFAVRRKVGVSYLVTTGNEAVLDAADYLRAIAGDGRVKSVAAYIEAVRRPLPFLEALDTLVGAGVPVTVLMAGRSEGGRRATQAHTGAVGTDSRIWSSMLRSVGAVQVEDLGELAEAATFALRRPFGRGHRASPDGDRPFLMSLSGAAASLMADLAERASLDLRQPGDALARALRAALPEATAIRNPLDLTGFVADSPERIGTVAGAVDGAGDGLLPVMVLNSPAAASDADQRLYLSVIGALARHDLGSPSHATSGRPAAQPHSQDAPAGASRAIGTMLPGDIDAAVADACAVNAFPVVAGMRTLTTVLAARADAERGRDEWGRARTSPEDREFVQGVKRWLGDVGGDPGPPRGASVVSEGRTKDLLGGLGLPIPRRIELHGSEPARVAAQLGFPVVVKVDDPGIPHKARAGCVVTGLHDPDAVVAAVERVTENASRVIGTREVRAIVIEEQVDDGVDLFIGALRSGELDPVIVAGLGGTAVEAGIGGVALRSPVDRRSFVNAARRSELGTLVEAVGGAPGEALRALAEVAVATSKIARALGPSLLAIDLNPVRLLSPSAPSGGVVRAVVLDALVELRARTISPVEAHS